MSKEVLAARAKIARESKQAKAEAQAAQEREWKAMKKRMKETPAGDEKGLSKEVLAQRKELDRERVRAKKEREQEIAMRTQLTNSLKTSLTKF